MNSVSDFTFAHLCMSERKEDNAVNFRNHISFFFFKMHYWYTSQMCHLCNRKQGFDGYVVP